MSDTVGHYDLHAGSFAARYEAVSAETVHAAELDFIPRGAGLLALDVGAGSGRDAAWLASLGYEVVAAEPAAGMRREGQLRHPDARIRWIEDRLPELGATHRLCLSFDLILVTAVWMHVPPPARDRAFRKLATLLKPGGILILSLRDGPSDPERPMWPAPAGEIEAFARTYGLAVLRCVTTADHLGRADVRWTTMVLRLPDDGGGALPLLRGIILNDDKSSTYKLGLLRAIARVADATPGLAVPHLDADAVDLPLGAVALSWLRMYLPLIKADLPQAPRNRGADGLGFVKAAFRELLGSDVAGQDLRIGARFSEERATAIVRALSDAARTIAGMPATHIHFPGSRTQVFVASLATPPPSRGELIIDGDALAGFGTLTVPGHVWRTLQRLGSWVEPALIGEWSRLVRSYAQRMGRHVATTEIEAALAWLEPVRDTQLARAVAQRALEQGRRVSCVWTGARLASDTINIDHCLPWSAWPCGDLWNLLPATSRVNQRLKRDLLPSAAALAAAHDSIIAWWDEAWLADPALRIRFERETAAALPVTRGASAEDVFTAVQWRRLRLRQDQQVPEWPGAKPSS